MFGVLVESSAAKQRRAGGALLSVAAHAGLIAAAVIRTATPATGTPGPDKPVPVTYITVKPSEPRRQAQPAPVGAIVDATIPRDPIVVVPPVDVPTEIPPIGPARPFDPDRLFIGSAEALARRIAGPVEATSGTEGVFMASDVERLAELVTPVRPTYPAALRLAGISGRVVMRFVVDTTGHVEPGSIQVMQSTEARFESAVREVLPRMRFRSARIGKQSVRMLVEMPFEFVLDR